MSQYTTNVQESRTVIEQRGISNWRENQQVCGRQMYSWVISEISDAERVGVPVRVDGVLYSTRDARVLHQVMEDHYYMKSYVGDEAGKICEIDFDHITEF